MERTKIYRRRMAIKFLEKRNERKKWQSRRMKVCVYIYIYFFFFLLRKELIKIRIVIFVQFTIIYFHIDWLVLFMHIGHI